MKSTLTVERVQDKTNHQKTNSAEQDKTKPSTNNLNNLQILQTTQLVLILNNSQRHRKRMIDRNENKADSKTVSKKIL